VIDTLSLDDLGHDPQRDRPTHLFPVGFNRSVPQRARCGTLVHPPFRRHDAPWNLCVVCADNSRTRAALFLLLGLDYFMRQHPDGR
jgi:hypothetical protein